MEKPTVDCIEIFPGDTLRKLMFRNCAISERKDKIPLRLLRSFLKEGKNPIVRIAITFRSPRIYLI